MESRSVQARLEQTEGSIKLLQLDVSEVNSILQKLEYEIAEEREFQSMMLDWVTEQGNASSLRQSIATFDQIDSHKPFVGSIHSSKEIVKKLPSVTTPLESSNDSEDGEIYTRGVDKPSPSQINSLSLDNGDRWLQSLSPIDLTDHKKNKIGESDGVQHHILESRLGLSCPIGIEDGRGIREHVGNILRGLGFGKGSSEVQIGMMGQINDHEFFGPAVNGLLACNNTLNLDFIGVKFGNNDLFTWWIAWAVLLSHSPSYGSFGGIPWGFEIVDRVDLAEVLRVCLDSSQYEIMD